MNSTYYLVIVLAFLSVALAIEGLFSLWRAHRGPAARQIARRLQVTAEAEIGQTGPLLKQRKMSRIPALDRVLQQFPVLGRLDRALRQSGTNLNVLQFLVLTVAAAAACAVLGFAARLPDGLVLGAALLGGVAPALWIARSRSQRLAKIDKQLPDMMDLMARALRAGHSFSSALQMAGSEGPEPAAREFRIAFDEIGFGISVPDAMLHLAARIPSNDLRYLVVAVVTQRETGGNLAELLSNTATLIRGRHKLLGTVRVLAAEGKLSAWILVILPFALGALVYAVNPEFMKILWSDPMGLRMVTGALVAMSVGVFWMSRVVKIRV